jgi:hypothetical protein
MREFRTHGSVRGRSVMGVPTAVTSQPGFSATADGVGLSRSATFARRRKGCRQDLAKPRSPRSLDSATDTVSLLSSTNALLPLADNQCRGPNAASFSASHFGREHQMKYSDRGLEGHRAQPSPPLAGARGM